MEKEKTKLKIIFYLENPKSSKSILQIEKDINKYHNCEKEKKSNRHHNCYF
jgi:hypothetical protein